MSARWTTSHQIPISIPTDPLIVSDYNPGNHAVAIDNNIWIFCEGYENVHDTKLLEVFIFDTETRSMTKIPVSRPINMNYFIYTATSHKDQVYLWTKDDNNYELWRFDTKSLEFQRMLNIVSYGIFETTPIIGNEMFLLEATEWTRNQNKFLITIVDLNGKIKEKVTTNIPSSDVTYDQGLQADNDKLYFFQYTGVWRKVYLFENQKMKLISKDRVKKEDDKDFQLASVWFHGSLFLSPADITISDETYLDTYDFNKLSWDRVSLEKSCYNHSYDRLRKFVKFYKTIYCVTEYSDPRRLKYEVRVLELAPKLTDICLLNLVDKVISSDDKEEIQTRLPNQLKKQLDLMTTWRFEETKYSKVPRNLDRFGTVGEDSVFPHPGDWRFNNLVDEFDRN